MSGGSFDYQEYYTAQTFEGVWEDEELNELFLDLFVKGFGHRDQGLVRSLDLARSGDICMETYYEEVKRFKQKWFNRTPEDSLEFYKEKLQEECDRLKEEMARQ